MLLHQVIRVRRKKNTVNVSAFSFSGRRFVELDNFIEDLRNLNDHNTLGGCNFSHMVPVKETRFGFRSKITFKCKMCNMEKNIFTEDPHDSTRMDVNTAAVCGIMSIGGGFSNLKEMAYNLNMPIMSGKTYKKYQEQVSHAWEDTSVEEMYAAAMEERRLAIENNECDRMGVS